MMFLFCFIFKEDASVPIHASPLFYVALVCFVCAAPLVVVFGIFKKITQLLGGESSSSSNQVKFYQKIYESKKNHPHKLSF